MSNQPRKPAPSLIGQPIEFLEGQFAGQTLRAELHELQKADLGRKYARKDRRPLDPPPIVQLKLFRVFNPGTPRECEQELDTYDEIKNFGLLCHIDLFQVPTVDAPDTEERSNRNAAPGRRRIRPFDSTPYQASVPTNTIPMPYGSGSNQQTMPFASNHYDAHQYGGNSHSSSGLYRLPGPAAGQGPITGRLHLPPPNPTFHNFYAAPPPDQSDVVARLGDYPIRESAKCTHLVSGATFVQAAEVDWQGKKTLMFVFSDLAVKMEGTFILRYRFLDIFSRAYGQSDLPVWAECYGGPFRVYSTKEFPGLSASTALTKRVSLWGVRANLRETERKRRKNDEESGRAEPSTGTSSKSPTGSGSLRSDDLGRNAKQKGHVAASSYEDGDDFYDDDESEGYKYVEGAGRYPSDT